MLWIQDFLLLNFTKELYGFFTLFAYNTVHAYGPKIMYYKGTATKLSTEKHSIFNTEKSLVFYKLY